MRDYSEMVSLTAKLKPIKDSDDEQEAPLVKVQINF